MKVTGEAFSFNDKRRSAEEARYQRCRTFQAKGLLLVRTLESIAEDYKKRIYMLIVKRIEIVGNVRLKHKNSNIRRFYYE